MIIRMDTDQIKKIRDNAFECAAVTVLESCSTELGQIIAAEIRAMKDSPVNVLAKGKS